MNTRLLLFIILTLTNIHDTAAQVFQRKNKRSSEYPPKAILVELRTYQRKQQYYLEKGFKIRQKQLLNDIDSIQHCMVTDFNDNFTYSPVYYFIDTNRSKILEGRFIGVLLDSNLQPATNIILQASDNYHIVYFGLPMPSPVEADNKSNDIFSSSEMVLQSSRQRLVILDSKGKMIEKPLPNGSNNIDGGIPPKGTRHYKYKSPLYDLYYVPYARNLSAKMRSFYGVYPYAKP